MKSRDKYERIARLYDAIDLAEVLYKRRVRPRLFAGLRGRILDAGIGTGCNVDFYPACAHVVGIDYSPAMLRRARSRAGRAGRTLALAAMDVQQTGFAARTFDGIVAAFVFSVLDEALQRPALAELGRVCKAEGEIRILDYRLSDEPVLRVAMGLWSPWQKAVYGCAFDRATERHVAEAGLELVAEEHLVRDMVRLLVARPGRA